MIESLLKQRLYIKFTSTKKHFEEQLDIIDKNMSNYDSERERYFYLILFDSQPPGYHPLLLRTLVVYFVFQIVISFFK